MLQPFRKYTLKKSWDRELTPKMAETNIFAFGKKEEDRFNYVTAPRLHYALANGDSVLWFSPNGELDIARALSLDAESELAERAREAYRNYSTIVVDLSEPLPHLVLGERAEQAVEQALRTPTIIILKTQQWKELNAKEVVNRVSFMVSEKTRGRDDATQAWIAKVTQKDENGINAVDRAWAQLNLSFCVYVELFRHMSKTEEERQNGVLIMHDACGNVVLDPYLFDGSSERFRACITMSSIVGYRWWRDRVGSELALAGTLVNISVDDEAESPVKVPGSMDQYAIKVPTSNKDTLYSYQCFFSRFQTVLCLGADDLNPAEHKRFIGQCMFATDRVAVGGRYAIEEIVSFADRVNQKTVRKESVLSKEAITDDIESHKTYSEICEKGIAPGKWIVEFGGHLRLHYSDGIYFPVVFPGSAVEIALFWLTSEIKSSGGTWKSGLASLEGDVGIILDMTDVDGKQMDVSLMRIPDEAAAEQYRDKYLLSILEMGEAESVLELNYERMGITTDYSPTLQREVLADYICRKGLNALVYPEAEVDVTEIAAESASAEEPPFEIPEEYRWKGYTGSRKAAEADDSGDRNEDSLDNVILPETGVLFLGGHQNMTKKLKQLFPKWAFMSDDLFYKGAGSYDTVFFWNKHCSHSMVSFVQARSKNADVVYVSATNIEMLVREMKEGYAKIGTKAAAAACV